MDHDLGSEVLFGDAMFGPPTAEVVVGDGEPTDQPGQFRIVRVLRYLAPEDADAGAGNGLPIFVEITHPGCGEGDGDVVPVGSRDPCEVRDQSGRGRVPGEDVHPGTEDQCLQPLPLVLLLMTVASVGLALRRELRSTAS